MSAGSLPKCGFVPCRGQVISVFGEKQPMSDNDCMRNANKSNEMLSSAMLSEVEVIHIGDRHTKINRFFPLLGPIRTPAFNEIGY